MSGESANRRAHAPMCLGSNANFSKSMREAERLLPCPGNGHAGLMTVFLGDFEDFTHLDLHLLAAADAHGQAQIRLDRARISARTQNTLPEYHPDGIAAARSGS